MVKIGVIGSGRLARSVVESALLKEHDVVTVTPDLEDYEIELKQHPELTVLEGFGMHDGDVKRLVMGGVDAPEGSIKRTVSGSYGFSVKKMMSGMSQNSGVSTRASSNGLISRSQSRGSVSSYLSSLPKRVASGLSSSSYDSEEEMDDLDILTHMLELENQENYNQNKIAELEFMKIKAEETNPALMAAAKHYATHGLPGNPKKKNLTQFKTDEIEMIPFALPQLQECDAILVASSDEHGYLKGDWGTKALTAVLKACSTEHGATSELAKKIFVVTRNSTVYGGQTARKMSNMWDTLETPNPSGWGLSSTCDDQMCQEELMIEAMRLNFYNNNTDFNKTSFTLVRVNGMFEERDSDRTINGHFGLDGVLGKKRAGGVLATAQAGYVPFIGVNSGDVADFLLSEMEKTSSDWENKVCYLHPSSGAVDRSIKAAKLAGELAKKAGFKALSAGANAGIKAASAADRANNMKLKAGKTALGAISYEE